MCLACRLPVRMSLKPQVWVRPLTPRWGLGFIREMTRVRDTFEPDIKMHERYDELYYGVYKQMYKRLQPLYQEMRKR